MESRQYYSNTKEAIENISKVLNKAYNLTLEDELDFNERLIVGHEMAYLSAALRQDITTDGIKSLIKCLEGAVDVAEEVEHDRF